MPPAEECDALAATQHGVLSRAQALDAGLSERAIERRLASGLWKVVFAGVYVPRPVPSSWRQRLMAAVLYGGHGALASHRSAAALWGLEGAAEGPVEISVKAGRRIAGVVVHRRRPADHPPVVLIDNIPTTGIERTLLDVAAVAPPHRVAPALDEALRRRLTTIEAVFDALPARGRAGTKTLRELLAARDDRDGLLESQLESALLHLVREHGLPLPVPQHRVSDGGAVVARLDFAYPSHRLGIETDGYRWHGGVERWKRDLRRENRLKLLGWTVLRFSWEDVHDRPESVAGQIRTALARARFSSPPTVSVGIGENLGS